MNRVWVLALVSLIACRRAEGGSGGPAPTGPEVTAASTNFLFTWIDDRGEFHIETKADDVPAASRETVRVADPSRELAENRVWLVDLRAPGNDGKFPVRESARTDFEAIAVARRQKSGAVLTSKAPAKENPGTEDSPAQAGIEGPEVIIYGASWCGPCHQAEAYLKKRGVRYVQKDIEADRGAAKEMQAKLAKVGKHGGSIPVLDVRGHILVGFDPSAISAALGTRL